MIWENNGEIEIQKMSENPYIMEHIKLICEKYRSSERRSKLVTRKGGHSISIVLWGSVYSKYIDLHIEHAYKGAVIDMIRCNSRHMGEFHVRYERSVVFTPEEPWYLDSDEVDWKKIENKLRIIAISMI